VVLLFAWQSPGASWSDQLAWLSSTFWGWFWNGLNRGASHHPVVFAMLVAWIGYVLGLSSSILAFRLQRAWWPLVLNATVGVIHLSYVKVEALPTFLLSIFVGILFVASLEVHLRQASWRASGFRVSGSSTGWALLSAAILAGVSLVAGLNLPAGEANADLAAVYKAATDPWQETQRQFERLIGGGRGQARPGSDLSFGTSLTPREDLELGAQPVLRVVSPQRRYWKTATFDRYESNAMRSSDTLERRFGPRANLPSEPDAGRFRTEIEQSFTILTPSSSALFAADAPRRFSVALVLDERQVDWDQASWRAATQLQRGQTYVVQSAVSMAGRQELAEAAARYPDWLDRYRELPSTLPARVGALTNQVTAGASNPLERALLVESYLRGLTYTTHATVPPSDRDWVDFLLFDSRSGYCDYFSIAMAVMLRTQGIPARVASGFAPGTFDEQQRGWIVRESDAHSWTEVYFPGYGWVNFEPSASRPTPERIETARVEPPPGSAIDSQRAPIELPDDLDRFDGGFAPALEGSGLTAPGAVLATWAGLLLALGALLAAISLVWERGLRGLPPARRRFAQLGRLLRWFGIHESASATPYEVARSVASRLPGLSGPLSRLTALYVEATYRGPLAAHSQDEVDRSWSNLRDRLPGVLARYKLERILRRRARPNGEAGLEPRSIH
jgi:transglutaminase-like putative cysteine protease